MYTNRFDWATEKFHQMRYQNTSRKSHCNNIKNYEYGKQILVVFCSIFQIKLGRTSHFNLSILKVFCSLDDKNGATRCSTRMPGYVHFARVAGRRNWLWRVQPMLFLPMSTFLPVLLLDVLVPECRTEMVYIPDIGSIKPQKSDMFAENPDYHGEVAEFFANYMRRMDKLEGIAINSWSNKCARKIFLDTERTFDATKYEGSKDFEIDWLIFTNSTMAVVEVGMRCEAGEKDSGKKSKNRSEEERVKRIITSKVGQIAKDTTIVRKLLEATNSSGVLVYFFAVFPNIAFETVQKRIQFHQESLDGLFKPTNNL